MSEIKFTKSNEVIEWDDNYESILELAEAIEAMHSSCVSAIRYGGEDVELIRKLVNLKMADCVDALRDAR